MTGSNNHPDVVAKFKLDTVSQVYDACPAKVQTDCGSENGAMAAMQCTVRQDIQAHQYG